MFENTMFLRNRMAPELPEDIKRALGMETGVGERKRPTKKVSMKTKSRRRDARASRKANR